MPRHDSLQEQVELVGLAAKDPRSPESGKLFQQALRGRQNLPAARAAQAVGKHRLSDLVPDLAASFSHFCASDPARQQRLAEIAQARGFKLEKGKD